MNNLTLTLLLWAGLAAAARAQSVDFSKEKFGEDKQGLREALRELKAGDADYQADPPRYALALPHYLAAQQFNPDNAELNLKLGECYLHSGTKTQALSYLQRAQQLAPGAADPRTHYLLARALHLSAKWAEAIKEYQLAGPLAGGRRAAGDALVVTQEDLARRVRECRNGQELMQHPARVFIDNAGPEVNSAYSDYGPVVSADEGGAALYLAPPRPGQRPQRPRGRQLL